MISVLTPTGARQKALDILGHWIRQQEYADPVRWVVVDDGPEPSVIPAVPGNWSVELIRPAPLWRPGQNTQHRNMLEGLKVIADGKLIIAEDDDAYLPGYLSQMASALDRYDLVGERKALYYHIGQRAWREMSNMSHASLCSTALRGREAIDHLRKVCRQGHRMIDHQMWRTYRGKLLNTRNSIGIKGLPGRPGIGVGHKLANGTPDPDMSFLRSLIGDTSIYE